MAQGQERTAPDAVPTRIGQVVMLHHAGDREEARHRYLGLWAEIGESGDPLHRCTLAHYLADTQDDPADELAWDLRALAAAEELTAGPRTARPADRDPALADVTPADATPADIPPVDAVLAARSLRPSLHLDLAADYDRLGRAEAARLHLRRARRAAEALVDDRHAADIRAAIDRLEQRMDDGGPAQDGPWDPPRQRP
ncbi:hypothetical protein [Streptomyces sp. CRN 30]|uniref:hypothetical protein n=1 Tax=Streptomyces sp. CRN 30 TaxID=3075613 RepID=UPI002A80F828|nr:hypothetical protein [Streptomyces sp. CRN 30]